VASSVDVVYRDYNTSGVPASGDHKPRKPEIRALLKMIQNSGGQSVTRNTLTALQSVTPPNENYMGVVLTGTGAGYYSRSSSAWVFGRGFPDTFAQVDLAGSGTAQTGILGAGVNPASIEVFFAKVATPNTGPMTLSVGGGTARQIVNLAGNPLSAGEWTGMVMFYLNEDEQYQLLIDAGAAASAAASATAAGIARDAAIEAAAGAGVTDGDKGDVTVAAGGTEWSLSASVYADSTEAEEGTDSVKLMTPLRTLQQGKARGFFSLKDFASTVIDNGSNSAVSAFQGAVNSGEEIRIPKASTSYLLDGNVAINNPVKLLGSGNGCKIKRVSNVGSFLLRASHIHLGGFVEDGSAMTGSRALFYMDTATGASPIYIQHSIIENVRSFHSGGLFDDNDAKGSSPTPVIWDLLVRNVYAFGCRGRGIRMRDGFAFLRFEDVEIGLGPQNMGEEYPAYEFRNFEGLFLRRVECTGLAGYTDLGYTPTAAQRGFIFANGAALHINSLFADNNVGEGARFENVQYIDGNDLNSSINSGTGFYFANADRVNINTLRSGGRRNMAPGTLDATSFGVWMDASCAKVNMGQIVTHNWGNHGFYSQATDLMLTGLQSFENGGRGYVAEGSTGRSLLVGAQLRDNVTGNYFIGGTSVNKMASLQLADGSYVDSVTTQPATG